MKLSLFLSLLIALTGIASAQSTYVFGVEQPVPRQQTIAVEETVNTFREYQAAVLNNDPEYVLSILGEPERSKALETIGESNVLHYAGYNSSLITWEIKCVACWGDETEGHQCALEDWRSIPSKNNNKGYSGVYVFEKENGTVFIVEKVDGFRSRGRKLKRKQKENKRVCDLGRYNLQLGTPNQPSRRNGAKSLLRGVAGVLDALGD